MACHLLFLFKNRTVEIDIFIVAPLEMVRQDIISNQHVFADSIAIHKGHIQVLVGENGCKLSDIVTDFVYLRLWQCPVNKCQCLDTSLPDIVALQVANVNETWLCPFSFQNPASCLFNIYLDFRGVCQRVRTNIVAHLCRDDESLIVRRELQVLDFNSFFLRDALVGQYFVEFGKVFRASPQFVACNE